MSSIISNSKVTPDYGHLPENCVPYGYPFFAEIDEAKSVQRLVNSLGVEVIKWPDLPEAILLDAPDYYSNLWLVNFL